MAPRQPRFTLRPFDQVLGDVTQAIQWYAHLGIVTKGTRLEEIEEKVRDLLQDLDTCRPEEVVERRSNTETYYALSDGAAFGKIARELSQVGPNLLPRRKLRTILEGPLSPLQENPADATVNARNHFSELELAADFSERGIRPTGFDDLRFVFEDVDYWVECKRLHSHRRVRANIGEAYGQLQRKLPDDRARGAIALVVDRVLGLDQRILRLQRAQDLNNEVSQLVDQFRAEHQTAWLNFVDTRIVAMLIIVRFLCYTVARDVIGPAYYVAFATLTAPEALQGTDFGRMRRLVDRLTAANIAAHGPFPEA